MNRLAREAKQAREFRSTGVQEFRSSGVQEYRKEGWWSISGGRVDLGGLRIKKK
jgi:hypothetical protein